MRLELVTAPSTEPVAAAEVWDFLRLPLVDGAPADQADVADMTTAARQRLDGEHGLLGRCLITQTWKAHLDAFPSVIMVPLPPCQSVDSIVYRDADGNSQTLATSKYDVVALGGDDCRIIRAEGESWPSTDGRPEAVTVTFTAGYGDAATDVPEPIRMVLKQTIATMYEHREFIGRDADEVPLPDMVGAYRLWSF